MQRNDFMTSATKGIPRKKSIRALANRDTPSARETQLLEIACRLFGLNGYDRTSLRDIAEAAGITKAALYYHFPDKEALYERVVIDALGELNAYLRERMDASAPPIERVRVFFEVTALHLQNHRYGWLAASNAFWADPGKRRGEAIRLRDAFEHQLRDCVAAGVKDGSFRNVDPSLAGKYLLSCFGHVARWHSSKGPLSVEQIMEQFLDFALNGLATSPVEIVKR